MDARRSDAQDGGRADLPDAGGGNIGLRFLGGSDEQDAPDVVEVGTTEPTIGPDQNADR